MHKKEKADSWILRWFRWLSIGSNMHINQKASIVELCTAYIRVLCHLIKVKILWILCLCWPGVLTVWTLDPSAVNGTFMCGERGEGRPPSVGPWLPIPFSVSIGSQKAWRQFGRGRPLHIVDALQYPQKVLTGLLMPVTSFVFVVRCSNFFCR